jgi:hypothetical protein
MIPVEAGCIFVTAVPNMNFCDRRGVRSHHYLLPSA